MVLEPSDGELKFAYRHRKKIYTLTLFTLALVVVAGIPGAGYKVIDLELSQAGVISGSSGTGVMVNNLFSGHIQVHFNPALYPISFLMGKENVYRKFRGAAEFWDYGGEQLKEAVTLGTLVTELLRNLPYFFAASLLATLLTMRLAKTSAIRRLMPKSKTQNTAYL